MKKITKFYIILSILQNVDTDKIKNIMKARTNEENYNENIMINDIAISDNKTIYNDVFNQNNTNDYEYYTDLNNNDTAITYDEISDTNEFSNSTQVNIYGNEDDSVKTCQFEEDIYILDGQVVEAAIGSAQPPILWAERCKPSITVNAIFNMSMTESVFELFLVNLKWTSVPESSIAEKAYMKNVTPVGLWGGCSKLTEITIETPNLTLTPPDWLANCTLLNTMHLANMKLSQLTFILDSAPRVTDLILRGINEIDTIVYSPVFPSARGAHQWITKIEMRCYNVEYPDIESGVVTSADMSLSLVWQLSLLPQLKTLNILDLIYFDFCTMGNLSSVTLQSLQSLMMYQTDTHYMCLRESRKLPQLTFLNIDQTNINVLQFGELFSVSSPQLFVSLELTIVQKFNFFREDYLALTSGIQKSNVTLYRFQYIMECDCRQSLWLARSLIEGVVTAPYVTCRDGSALKDQNCDWLYCERVSCNNDCVCCIDEPGTVVGDCRDANISALPDDLLNWNNLTSLVVPYNNLTQLPDSLPANLKWLDLSGNDVFRKSGEAEILALFAAPERHVLLFGNAIICSCDTQSLIKILQDHKDQIEDYKNLTCAGDNSKLSTVEVSALCTDRNRQKSVILIVSLLLFAAVLALILSAGYYYRKSIQIYLFARGWCLFCIKEDELDADREYDVFLSFCYEDDKIVMEQLLPVLDREYSVCVHYRDWCPGDMIPTQITKSVEQSKRTVVVLSRNFIRSLWGLLEFRTAHVSGLMEGRVRVVMVVLDDILEDENLETEVKAYVRLNTYVKWGDPWFWDKLKFALPHRPSPFRRNINSEHLAPSVNEHLPMVEFLRDSGPASTY